MATVPAPQVSNLCPGLPQWKLQALQEAATHGSTTTTIAADVRALPELADWSFVSTVGKLFDAVINPQPGVLPSHGIIRFTCYGNSAGFLPGIEGDDARTQPVMSMTPLHMQHHAGHVAGQPDALALIRLTISLHIAGIYALSPLMGWLTHPLGPVKTMLVGLGTLTLAVALTGLALQNMGAVSHPSPRISASPSRASPTPRALGSAAAGPLMGIIGYPGISAVGTIFIAAAAGSLLRLSTQHR